MKKILSLMLAAVLVFTLLPVSARADNGEKLVALTFDDGPHKTYTKQLLDGLLELDATVTFFMVGQNAKSYPDLVQRAYDEGHEVANHTWSHPDLTGQGYSGTQSQLSRANEVLDAACGKGTTHILRPPYGSYNSTTRSAAGVPLILWSVDTNDWRYRNYSHTYNHIINNAYDGAIILCHDIHSSTIPAALDAIKTLQARGYEFVSVSELYRRKGQEMKNGQAYTECEKPTLYSAVKAPTITYEATAEGVFVTMESADGAPIYYNTDGSRFTQESKVYTGPFRVECPVTIQAVAAFNLNGGRSDVTTLELDLIPCLDPAIKIDDGKLILTCPTAGAPIYFTLDGSTPTTNSLIDTDNVYLEPGTFVQAVAGGGNYTISGTVSKYYSPMGNVFADVYPGRWYEAAIDQLVSEGMIKGLGNDMVGPDNPLTRAQLVELLYRYDGQTAQEDTVRSNTFVDVADDNWFAASVEWAFVNEIVEGYPEGDFRPEQHVTRQEMAKIIDCFLTYRGNKLPEGEDCRESFKDGDQIGEWAQGYVNAVVSSGLIQGDTSGNVLPNDTATRAQFATILLRMRELEAKMELEREEAEKEESTEPSEPVEGEEESTNPSQPAEGEEESTDPSQPAQGEEEPADPSQPAEGGEESTDSSQPEQEESAETTE